MKLSINTSLPHPKSWLHLQSAVQNDNAGPPFQKLLRASRAWQQSLKPSTGPCTCGHLRSHTGPTTVKPALATPSLWTKLSNLFCWQRVLPHGAAIWIWSHLLPSLFYLPETRTSTPFPGTKTSLPDKMYSIDLYLCGLVTPVLPNEAK